MGKQLAEVPAGTGRRFFTESLGQLSQQPEGAQPAFGATAFISKLGTDLVPAVADFSQHIVVANEHRVEHDFVEIVFPREVDDGAYADTGRRQIDNELADAGMPVFARGFGPAQREHVVRVVRVAVPQLGAGYGPAALYAFRARAQRRQIRARVGLAQAYAEYAFPLRDTRQVFELLFFGSEFEQQRSGLTVRYPVCPHRSPGRQQLLRYRIALERAALVPPVFLGPGHAYPAALRQLAGQVKRNPHADIMGTGQRSIPAFFRDELAHFTP